MHKTQLTPLALLSLLKNHRVPVIPLGVQLKNDSQNQGFLLVWVKRTLNTRFAQMFSSLYRVFYVYVCFVCMYVCTPCSCLVSREPKESIRLPRTRVEDSCLLLCGLQVLNPGLLQKQQVPFTTKSYLQCQEEFNSCWERGRTVM